jgi:hypothetical protein
MKTRAVVCALLIITLDLPALLPAQDAKLVDAAKGEGGKAGVYGSLENETMDLISGALKKKTGLETEFYRASSTKVMDRALNEFRAGKPLFDVVLMNDAPMQFLSEESLRLMANIGEFVNRRGHLSAARRHGQNQGRRDGPDGRESLRREDAGISQDLFTISNRLLK